MNLSDLRFILQGATTVVIMLIMYIQIRQFVLSKKNIGYFVAMIFWMAHALIFYVFVFLNHYGLFSYLSFISSNTWSSALRFHGYFTILCIEASRYSLIKIGRK